MAGAERIIHIAIRQRGQLLGEILDVLGLFLAEAGVLEQHHVAVLHRGDGGLRVLADNVVVVREHNRLAQVLGETLGNGREGELGFRAVLRLAQVAAKNHLAAVRDQLLDRRQRGHDALVVGDLAILHRNIEIAAHKHFLAGDLDVVHRHFCHG